MLWATAGHALAITGCHGVTAGLAPSSFAPRSALNSVPKMAANPQAGRTNYENNCQNIVIVAGSIAETRDRDSSARLAPITSADRYMSDFGCLAMKFLSMSRLHFTYSQHSAFQPLACRIFTSGCVHYVPDVHPICVPNNRHQFRRPPYCR